MFYREKSYYEENNAQYLFLGMSKINQGKRLISGRHGEKDKIQDESLKGEVSLSYEFV